MQKYLQDGKDNVGHEHRKGPLTQKEMNDVEHNMNIKMITKNVIKCTIKCTVLENGNKVNFKVFPPPPPL